MGLLLWLIVASGERYSERSEREFDIRGRAQVLAPSTPQEYMREGAILFVHHILGGANGEFDNSLSPAEACFENDKGYTKYSPLGQF